MNIKILTELLKFPNIIWLTHNKNMLNDFVQVTFNVDLVGFSYTKIEDVVSIIDVQILNNYFGYHWNLYKHNNNTKAFVGQNVIDAVNRLNPKKVLDVGCGFNQFKDGINGTVIGIDPYNTRADIKISLELYATSTEYDRNNFDVILCLGSINFGSIDKISRELEQVVGMLAPGGTIFFRVNPGLAHKSEHSKWIDFFKWDPELINIFAKEFNMEMSEIVNEYEKRFIFSWKSIKK